MIRQYEHRILEGINFAERYSSVYSKYILENNSELEITKAEIRTMLRRFENYKFKNSGSDYYADKHVNGWTFRLIMNIKYNRILPYIFVLYDNKFVLNGLTNLGKLLIEFDFPRDQQKHKFGFNNTDEMYEFIFTIFELFEDFIEKYIEESMKLSPSELDELKKYE